MNRYDRPVRLPRQLKLFLVALGFYTRIPVSSRVMAETHLLGPATAYFPAMGLITGGLAAAVWWGAHLFFPPAVAILLSMAAAVLCTGAFHEDGLADTADGFGGGWTVEQKLEIMKDSRVGTYGLITLVLALLLRFHLLLALPAEGMVQTIIAVHVGARFAPVLVIALLPYVRADELSKAKPISKGVSPTSVLLALAITTGVTMALRGRAGLLGLCTLMLLVPLAALFFRKHLGGYTGDTLGATEQVSELTLLAAALLL
ncbi:cobalamin-5'-phosphate synthase [Alkalispirochaeta americana]|uniref:Adenosylcobinamide-GDP ribazoletransferase n=1 Tax=Alkalispirochaeta americana TaxID=159291 RepID=A0A1N6PU90_9SPIO|nr:adenosylcobinamide-GDP ribazoletransferase [Alkalispirochaeta americana]SIQ07885.1 cobalamin-5'-phosphate synthase [Alkalispirochaeta americana]